MRFTSWIAELSTKLSAVLGTRTSHRRRTRRFSRPIEVAQVLESRSLLAAAIPAATMMGATVSTTNQLTLDYRLENLSANENDNPVEFAVYRETDGTVGGTDSTLIASFEVKQPKLRVNGTHQYTVGIGSGEGLVSLPGAGIDDTLQDYRLVVVLDPRHLITTSTDMLQQTTDLSGVYVGMNANTRTAMVFGTSNADTISFESGRVGMNGKTLLNSGIASIRVRSQGGDDVVNLAASNVPTLMFGGAGNDMFVGGQGIDMAFGGNGDDILIGNSGSDQIWGGDGADVLDGGSGDDTLIGGNGNDTYRFRLDTATQVLGVDTLDEGPDPTDNSQIITATFGSQDITRQPGIDTLDFSTITLGVTIDLSYGRTDVAYQAIPNRLSLKQSGGSVFENAIGGSGNDTLIGNNQDNVMDGRAGGDTYVFDASNAKNLRPGHRDVVRDSSDSTSKDTLDFSATNADTNLWVILSSTEVREVAPNYQLQLETPTALDNLIGGSGNDRLIGNNNANLIQGNAGHDYLDGVTGDDTLDGGLGNENYYINASKAIGKVMIKDAGGIDLLAFRETTAETGVQVNLGTITAQAVTPRLTLVLNSTTLIDDLAGGQGDDILSGNGLDNVIVGEGGNDVLSGGAGNDRLYGDTGADVLEGGAGDDRLVGGFGDDTYRFRLGSYASSLGTDTLDEGVDPEENSISPTSTSGSSDPNQQPGVDTLDFSAITSSVFADLSYARTDAAYTAIVGKLNLKQTGGSVFENVIGGSGNDTLIGNNQDNVLDGRAGGDTYKLNASAVNNLRAGHRDTIRDTSGPTSKDTLDFSATTGDTNVWVILSSSEVREIAPNYQLQLETPTAFDNLIGGSGNDRLIGNINNNLICGNAGHDFLDGITGDDTLDGGLGNENYYINGSKAAGTVTIKDAGGTDLLAFRETTPETGIQVNLGTTIVQSVTPQLKLKLSSKSIIDDLAGGQGNDILIGNDLNNFIDGESGDDVLIGGAGNDQLSGQVGADTLEGGLGDDRLIGGYGNDTYRFRIDAQTPSLGTDTLDEGLDLNDHSQVVTATYGAVDPSAQPGVDTLDFSDVRDDVTVDLSYARTDVAYRAIGNKLSLKQSGGSVFENVNGGLGNDVLIGNDQDNILNGGAGGDTYKLDASQAKNQRAGHTDIVRDRSDTSAIDTLDFSATTSDTNISVNLSSSEVRVLAPNYQLQLETPLAFDNILSGHGSDNLIGNINANVIRGNTGHDLIDGVSGNDLLDGGLGNENYYINASKAVGTVTIKDNDDGNLLAFRQTTSETSIRVDIGTTTVQSVTPQLQLKLESPRIIHDLVGGQGDDTLIGNDLLNTIEGEGGNDTIAGGREFDYLNGMDGDDILIGGISGGILNGGNGNDHLVFPDFQVSAWYTVFDSGSASDFDVIDFSLLPGDGSLVFDLSWSGWRTVHSQLELYLVPGGAFEGVVGTRGNDVLIGDSRPNFLFGSDGDDLIDGRAGSDFIVGGSGVDSLVYDDNDIVLAGSLTHLETLDFKSRHRAMQLLLAEWSRTDISVPAIMSHLTYGGGLNDFYLVTPETILND